MSWKLDTFIPKELLVCEFCIEGKETKRSFTTKGYKVKECFKLVHTNMCEPFCIHIRGRYEYFITFTNDYSRFGYIYLIQRKSNAFYKFIEFKAELKNQ